MKTRFIIVRHGESIGNAKRIILGRTDWDLSELGRRQAYCTASALADRRIDAVYSSDLLRAYNTVLPIAMSRGLEVVADEGLREIYLGDWECRSVDEVICVYGDLFTVSWRQHFGTFTPPGGESVSQLAERIERTLVRIADENLGKTVLIGCHAAAIRSFWGKINGVCPEDLAERFPFPDNASFSEVDYEDGVFAPISFSNAEHLSQILNESPF